MLNVIVILWQGNFRDRKFNHKEVERAKRMAERWIDYRPMRFICLTNAPKEGADYEQIPLSRPDDLPGWWAKCEAFRSDLELEGRCLYFDLDNIVCGGLDELIWYAPGLCIAQPTRSNPGNLGDVRKNKEGQDVVNRYQAAVMAWDAGDTVVDLDESIANGDVERFRSDQDFWGYYFPDATTFPREWCVKLRDCYKKGPSSKAKMVLGNPKALYSKVHTFSWAKGLIK